MNFPNQITGTFNKPITLGIGTVKAYKDNALFITFTQADINVAGNQFTIDVTNLFPDNGDYFILIDSGLFSFGTEIWAGINDNTKWTFTIQDGEFDASEFDNTEFLTT